MKSRSKPAVLVLTHTPDGAAYGNETGQAVSKKTAHEIQADLFVKPSEDGLFPGHSQTWKREG